MVEQDQVFHLPETLRQREHILVIGVGGGGGNALNHIIDSGVEGVEFLAANTDAKALGMSKAPHKIILGEKLTKGLGAGANPQVGMDAAKESIDRIREHVDGADMVFIAAGMGGGTGTGAAPVIAELARELGVLVVGVVTMPFSFERKKRADVAKEGVLRLEEKVDALLVVENDKLLKLADEKTTVPDAYKMANEVLRQAVQGVTDIILVPSLVNVDFADVKAIMKNSGSAIMGVGVGEGDNRAELAAKSAIKSPLMSVPLKGAKGILLNVAGPKDLGIIEMKKAVDIVNETADEDVVLIWGHSIDESGGGTLRITVIATGFSRDDDNPAGMIHSPDASQYRGHLSVASRSPSKGHGAVRSLADDENMPTGDEDMFMGMPPAAYDRPSIYRRKQK